MRYSCIISAMSPRSSQLCLEQKAETWSEYLQLIKEKEQPSVYKLAKWSWQNREECLSICYISHSSSTWVFHLRLYCIIAYNSTPCGQPLFWSKTLTQISLKLLELFNSLCQVIKVNIHFLPIIANDKYNIAFSCHLIYCFLLPDLTVAASFFFFLKHSL